MIIHARHRRYELAERHRRQLERKYGAAKILSRRNKAGEDSPRGTFYRFKVSAKNRKYVIVIEYIKRVTDRHGKVKEKIILKDLVITYKAGADEFELMDWIDTARADEVPNFVFESRIVSFAKGKFTNDEWDWRIRNHRGGTE